VNRSFNGTEREISRPLESCSGTVQAGFVPWRLTRSFTHPSWIGVPRRGAIVGQVTPEARDEASVRGAVVEALVDRVWQAGEAFTRAATLVEEAAVDLARRSLPPDPTPPGPDPPGPAPSV